MLFSTKVKFQATTINQNFYKYAIIVVQYSAIFLKLLRIVRSRLPFIPSPWRETKLFTRQVEVQKGRSTLIILTTKTIDADSGGK